MSRILIIDDDVDFARMLGIRISKSGHEALTAHDAYQGVELTHKKRPDLILLDLRMPAGGGLSALRDIRLSSNTRHIPIIVITGVADDNIKSAAMSEGVEGYLEKPFDSEVLLNTINKILSK